MSRTGIASTAAALWLVAAVAAAQSTTGTISGRVADTQGLPVPGVTIVATSPSLQGALETVTSGNGDYILPLLPSGTYTLTFELSGFGTQTRTVSVAPTQSVPLEVEIDPAAVTETVEVVARSADVLTETAQVATNFSQELIAVLPTARDVNTTLMLTASVHPTGPGGNYSIAGSMSFENLYMVNGVASLINPSIVLRCVESATGKVLWTQEKLGKYHAALLRTGDDKLLMLDDAGHLILLQPDPDGYKELSRAKICGPTWAHPALCDGKVYVRDEKDLICVQLVAD